MVVLCKFLLEIVVGSGFGFGRSLNVLFVLSECSLDALAAFKLVAGGGFVPEAHGFAAWTACCVAVLVEVFLADVQLPWHVLRRVRWCWCGGHVSQCCLIKNNGQRGRDVHVPGWHGLPCYALEFI